MIKRLKNKVIVSCQAMPSEPLYREECMAAMMKSVLNGGAQGLRVAGVRDVKLAKSLSDVPVIGLTKPEVIPKNWKEVVTHNKKGEYGHKHHKKTNRIVTGAFEKAKLMDATLKYFGKYHGRKYNKPSKYTRAQLRQKRKIVRLYRSQRSIYTFAHMNGYEDWITVK